MRKNVVFLEVDGGSDKGDDGHRKDTFPMVNCIKDKGWNADVVYYTDNKSAELAEEVRICLLLGF